MKDINKVTLSLEDYETLKKKADSVKIGYVYERYNSGYYRPEIQTESELVNELAEQIAFLANECDKMHKQIRELTKELVDTNSEKLGTGEKILKFLGYEK